MAKTINSVTGPLSPENLGTTLIHEHILFGYPGYQGDLTLNPFKWDEALKDCVNYIKPIMQKYNLKTIVDCTPNECGRNVLFNKAVSEATGLNIIAATGYYYEDEGSPAYFKAEAGMGTDVSSLIYELMKAEITQGIEGSDIRAGIIKLASSKDVISPYEQWFFKAAAKVSSEEGTPMITHTQEGTMGPEQAELLVANGADPKKVIIGHMCGSTDIRYFLKTLAHGVYISLDRFGLAGWGGNPTDHQRAIVIAALCNAGYTDRIMVGHDFPLKWLGRPISVPAPLAPIVANWNWENIPKNVAPDLKTLGLSDEQINMILVENPKKFFGY